MHPVPNALPRRTRLCGRQRRPDVPLWGVERLDLNGRYSLEGGGGTMRV
eukprot:CAMPEP_0114114858 /NCGR_PEP_ID=MMETSP0043_2-20121206/3660_1 /TAXON_ID=464988 /ORGANISM="Hemiselmis andersenii, Strain CCMP644" /LENGTH=48 /DNA_ID= /DNA_START= /DNA_END= /DNA_ORIENTATION=